MTLPRAVQRTILAVDVERFGDPRRTNMHRVAIRVGLYQVLQKAFLDAGIAWSDCDHEDRGDGVFIIAPSMIDKSLFVDRLPYALVSQLKKHNISRASEERIRLRMAMHAGEINYDAHGVTGDAMVLAFRLLDSADLRRALAESPGELAIIASDTFFRNVIVHWDTVPSSYRRVLVKVKEISAAAWICLPGSPAPSQSLERQNLLDFLVVCEAATRIWADWIAWELREAGYTVELDDGFRLRSRSRHAARTIIVHPPESRSRTAPNRLVERVVHINTADLLGIGEETARQRLLAAVGPERRVARTAPAYPGRPAPDIPAFPDSTPTGGQRALIVHAVPDTSFAGELSDSLRVLETEGLLSPVELRPVGPLDEETEQYVDSLARTADIVLLLVSRELLATGYGSTTELRLLMRRHEDREVTLLPIILKPTSWEDLPLGRLAALPSDGVPVSQWTSREEAIKNIVDGVRLAARKESLPMPVRRVEQLPVLELGAVFKPAGVPTLTFVEPDDFVEFRMALRQPGLGVVLEGPSGIGKTTLLRHAVKQDADQLGEVPVLSARKPAHLTRIRGLLDGHTGLVAVDDFQRLPVELQDQLADYLKLLADDDMATGKLVVVGIPGTARELVDLSHDVATRIRVFRLGRVEEELLVEMVEKGEAALNITFDRKAEIAIASAGSLLTAQMLCWHLTMMAGIEKTVEKPAVVRADIARARAKVADTLQLKYGRVVAEFVVFDGPDELLCIELLLELAKTDGILPLEPLAERRPELGDAIDRVFTGGMPTSEHLFYDGRGHRLIADDPQFVFYLRQLTREKLLEIAGKRMPVPREQIFICYSHQDAEWKDRVCVHLRPLERDGALDIWSDQRIAAGDMWRKEIAAALDRARVALLLISADFFASDFIHSEELPPLLAAAQKGGCRVIPVLVGPSMFDDIPELAHFQSVPSGTTLSEMSRERAERALVELARSAIG